MSCCPSLRRWLPVVVLLVVFVGLRANASRGPAPQSDAAIGADQPNTGNAGDWPMFGGNEQRNMANTLDKNLPTEWSVEEGAHKNMKWVAQLGSISYGGPVIASGKVFVGTNNGKPRDPNIKGDKGVLMCFRESDGQFVWQAIHDKLPNRGNDYGDQGIASTPAVEGNRLYYVSNRCELVCANTEPRAGNNAAELVWRLDMIKELDVFPRYLANGSPLIHGDLVYLVTGNGVADEGGLGNRKLPSPEAPSFLAVNKKTGKVAWQDHSPGDKVMDGQWSNPVYAEVNGKGQIIFPGGDGWLYSFEPTTGRPIWKFDCNPKASQYKVGGRGTRSFFLATPVVHENKVYVGVGQEPDDGPGVGHLWCVDITKSGDLSPVNDNFDPKAPVNKNSGLVWHYGGPAPKGSERDYFFGRTLSTCAIHDGLLYIADNEGYFYCLDAQSGRKYWEHDLKAEVWASPYWVDGKVYLGTLEGDVLVFAHGKEKKLLQKVDMKRPVRSTVVAVHGVLYIMTDSHLYAIAKK